MTPDPTIQSPHDANLDRLCDRLAALGGELDRTGDWPAEQLRLCGEHGVFQWFLPAEWGGQGWSEADVVRGYLRLSAACMTTTFILTQRTAACKRIAVSGNDPLRQVLLPALVSGDSFATVGISHLTTSRQHLRQPVLQAAPSDDGYTLDGFSPWVTGGAHAETVVTGGVLEDGRQLLVALPTCLPGVRVAEPARLVGLSASHTGAVQLQRVAIGREHVLAGPVEHVMASSGGAGTGGVQTSTLAVGLATQAIDYLEQEAVGRQDLGEPAEMLRAECSELTRDLLALASGSDGCSVEDVRTRANSLALRATQSALAAAKGSGYVVGHPAGRWCREALFFLVWSCPQPVMAANLCELAGIDNG